MTIKLGFEEKNLYERNDYENVKSKEVKCKHLQLIILVRNLFNAFLSETEAQETAQSIIRSIHPLLR